MVKSIISWVMYAVFFIVSLICTIVLKATNPQIMLLGAFLTIVCSRCFHTIYYKQSGKYGFLSGLLKVLSGIVAVFCFAVTLFLAFVSFMDDGNVLNMWECAFTIFWPSCIAMCYFMYSENDSDPSLSNASPFIPFIAGIITYVVAILFAYLYTIPWINNVSFFKFLLALLFFGASAVVVYFGSCLISLQGMYDLVELVTSVSEKTPHVSRVKTPVSEPVVRDYPEIDNQAVLNKVTSAVFKWAENVVINFGGQYQYMYNYDVECKWPHRLQPDISGYYSDEVTIKITGDLIITVYNESVLNSPEGIMNHVNDRLLESLETTVESAFRKSKFLTNQEYKLSCEINYEVVLE